MKFPMEKSLLSKNLMNTFWCFCLLKKMEESFSYFVQNNIHQSQAFTAAFDIENNVNKNV